MIDYVIDVNYIKYINYETFFLKSIFNWILIIYYYYYNLYNLIRTLLNKPIEYFNINKFYLNFFNTKTNLL